MLHTETVTSFTGLDTQALLLVLNGLLIMVTGPKKIIGTLHPYLRPYAYAVIVISFVWIVGQQAFTSPAKWPPHWATGGTLVSMGIFFGITFYATKILRPVLYGSIEIAAGICGLVLVAFMNPMNSMLALTFGVATSVYVIVRGVTNINDALNKDHPQPPEEDLTRQTPHRKPLASGKAKPRNSPEPTKPARRKHKENPRPKTGGKELS